MNRNDILIGLGAGLSIVVLVFGLVLGLAALLIGPGNHRYPETAYTQINDNCVRQTKYVDVEHGFMWWQTRQENVRTQIFCKPLITIDPRPIGPFIK